MAVGVEAVLGKEAVLLSQLAMNLSYVGRHDEAISVFNRGRDAPPPESDEDAAQATAALPALDGIARAAQGRRVVFINEAHHVPMHRAFTLRLLVSLRQAGFTHFAAEAFPTIAGGSEWRDAAPVRSPYGVLTDEPIYADLIRTAVGLGYKLVTYDAAPDCEITAETREKCIDQRERAAAEKLVRGIETEPNSKVLVHVGFGHGAKVTGPGYKSLGQYVAELTGSDPLSVDQVSFSPQDRRDLETPGYTTLLRLSGQTEPFVPVKGDGTIWRQAGPGTDIQVVHPRPRDQSGRPDWLRMGGLRDDVPIPPWMCGSARPCLVQAFAAKEDPERFVPVDQVLVRQGERMPVLVLPQGEHLIVARGPRGVLNTSRDRPQQQGPTGDQR
ncbi:hypothetical protein HHL28_08595 [Aerophototrophica crusticola]|uniref:Uncharacterized protein n=1 Tax=Aerophototrophica crusticola TaxID=1709002 RepID=A0A858R6W3_9PROT|nr:hypothetical protein HHL28_08595 [Rhodospirillaceae bacterium B3]